MYSNIPNLFVIGAAKSGTTTLYSILSRHHQVFMSHSKSTRFFVSDEYYDRGLEWYLQTYFAGAEQYLIRGEATPSYLAQATKTAPRIKNTIMGDNVKFIAIFRNPVERAYAHYWYNRNKKAVFQQEDLSFEDALVLEQERDNGKSTTFEKHPWTRDYFKNGDYSRCLKEYFKHFKREQFLLLLLEDLYKEQFHTTTTKITKFLGIEDVPINYVRENHSRKIGARPSVRFVKKQRGLMNLLKSFLPQFVQGKLRNSYSRMLSKPVKYPPMKPETQKMLLERYKPGIMELQELIGRDLSHWMNEG